MKPRLGGARPIRKGQLIGSRWDSSLAMACRQPRPGLPHSFLQLNEQILMLTADENQPHQGIYIAIMPSKALKSDRLFDSIEATDPYWLAL
ncbi:hypothetical protein DSO57_1017882 [Entomophthora muscae]|uniref:Uncharacterized protein n=1 Tax=Entomophthora muscae TaxID=34485 RepID=A0ACC2UEH0_9FUNG|nr:hypothetical protein DSO57_1017882 [Entomophthora muscae]